jgi:predicted transcriptional regulator
MKSPATIKAPKSIRIAPDVLEGIQRTAQRINRTQIQILEAACRFLLAMRQEEIEGIVMRLGRKNGK